MNPIQNRKNEELSRQIQTLRLGSNVAQLTLTSVESSAALLNPMVGELGDKFVFVVWGNESVVTLNPMHFALSDSQAHFIEVEALRQSGQDWACFAKETLQGLSPSLIVVMCRADLAKLKQDNESAKKSFSWRALWNRLFIPKPSAEETKIVNLRHYLLANASIAQSIRAALAEGPPVIEALYDTSSLNVLWDISREARAKAVDSDVH